MKRPAASIDTEFVCPVCERICPHMAGSRHHVLPKSQGGRVIETVGVDCHRQIHALFTVKELARSYSALETLCTAPAIQKWLT